MTAAVAGFVLAGGRSRRMGGPDKALLLWQGQPLALRAAETLARGGCRPVALVGNQPGLLGLSLPVITDASAGDHHPLWGVAAALAACPSPLALLCPCDLPALTAAVVADLLAQGQPCVAAGQPLLCVLARECAGYAETLARQGAPARHLAQALGLPTIPVSAASLRNINYPADLPSKP